jgi:hypothetical protein
LVRSGRSLILRYDPVIRLEGLRKTMKNLCQDSWLPGPKFEPGISRIQSKRVNHSTTTFGEKHETHNTINEQNAEILNVKAGGTYNWQRSLKVPHI